MSTEASGRIFQADNDLGDKVQCLFLASAASEYEYGVNGNGNARVHQFTRNNKRKSRLRVMRINAMSWNIIAPFPVIPSSEIKVI